MSVLAHRPAALLTDVDGTLSRIVPRPEDATVDPAIARSLAKLARQLDLVGVITAREEAIARRMVGAEGITYVGNYGLTYGAAALSREAVATARRLIEPKLADLPCVTLEDKTVAFALHYRNCDEPNGVRRKLLDLVKPIAAETGVRILEGKKVIEVVPAGLPDKASAFSHLIDAAGTRGVVYLGDDVSDVAVFAEIGRRRAAGDFDGAGIAVIDAETDPSVRKAADLTLGSVEEVAGLLAALAGRLGQTRGHDHA